MPPRPTSAGDNTHLLVHQGLYDVLVEVLLRMTATGAFDPPRAAMPLKPLSVESTGHLEAHAALYDVLVDLRRRIGGAFTSALPSRDPSANHLLAHQLTHDAVVEIRTVLGALLGLSDSPATNPTPGTAGFGAAPFGTSSFGG
jgi:hypothetical protein